MSVLKIPNELLDSVLDYLDMPDVINMRKAHSHFKSSARRLIFKDVCLPLEPYPKSEESHVLEKFLEVIHEDDTIIELVQTITLKQHCKVHRTYSEYARSHPWINDSWEDSFNSVPWIANGSVQSLLAKFSGLPELTLALYRGFSLELEFELYQRLKDM